MNVRFCPSVPANTRPASDLSDRHYPAVAEGIVQYRPPNLWRDLDRGYLAPHLMPVQEFREAMSAALAGAGWQALAYGNNSGPVPLKEQLVANGMVGADIDNICITGGISQALVLLAGVLATQGDCVAIEEPSYDLGAALLRDAGLHPLCLASDDQGPVEGALAECARQAAARGSRLAFAVVMPRHQNPTGRCLTTHRLRELVEASGSLGLPLIIDDAYGEIDFRTMGSVPLPLPDVVSDAPHLVVLGSFSKTLGGGIRLGYLVAARPLIARIERFGWTASGGGFNPINALAAAEFLRDGYRQHVRDLTHALVMNRDVALAELAKLDDPGLTVNSPSGGYFLWVRPATVGDSVALQSAFDTARVSVADGARFGSSGSGMFRLSFSSATAEQIGQALSDVVSVLRKESDD
ncbi:PLP-dependent aminotransferase family protein [Nocardia sp. CA-128927]|uniref:aminotransferase-like domain-containing protein n=1 Tax=Nocardia sp. CA-128927 TaxID=3239975 RepID=UPI003D958881